MTIRALIAASLIPISFSWSEESRVVEELVFDVAPSRVDLFILHDRAIWTKALASQPGFLNKEVWHDRKNEREVKLAIHWQSMKDWMSVPKKMLTETDAAFQKAMGGADRFKMVSSRAFNWEGEQLTSAFQFPGERILELKTLDLSGLEEVDVSIPHDAVYKRAKRYRALPLGAVVNRLVPGGGKSSEWEIVLECTDGYAPVISLEKARSGQGFLATRDLDAPKPEKWSAITKKDGSPLKLAPFYLVWNHPDKKAASAEPWPYQLVRLRLLPSLESNPSIAPMDPKHREGFRLFRQHCLRCHALDGIGGLMGPELHKPRNITTYWRSGTIAEFVRNPQGFRATSSMPAMAYLGDDKISKIVRYLESLAGGESEEVTSGK